MACIFQTLHALRKDIKLLTSLMIHQSVFTNKQLSLHEDILLLTCFIVGTFLVHVVHIYRSSIFDFVDIEYSCQSIDN